MNPLRIFCCAATFAVVTGCVLLPYEPDVATREGAPRISFVYEPGKVEASVSERDTFLWNHFECVRAGVRKADARFSVVEERAFWQSVSPIQELVRWEKFLSSRGQAQKPHVDYVVALHAFEYRGGSGPASVGLYGAVGPFAVTERIVASASLLSIREQKVVTAFEAEAVGKTQGAALSFAAVGTLPLTARVVCRQVVQTLIERLLALTAGQPARVVFLPAKPG